MLDSFFYLASFVTVSFLNLTHERIQLKISEIYGHFIYYSVLL